MKKLKDLIDKTMADKPSTAEAELQVMLVYPQGQTAELSWVDSLNFDPASNRLEFRAN